MLTHLKILLKKLNKIAPVPMSRRISYTADRLRKIMKIYSYSQKIGLNNLLWLIDTVEVDYGHFLSYEQKMCVERNGNPIPWYTYPAIEYLDQLDFSEKAVYEYGAGNSSVFWAKKAKSVISVENDQDWYLKIQSQQELNQKIVFLENEGDYVNFILKTEKKYDLIVIDGDFRFACAKVSIKCLEKGGFIILDNSDWYPETSKLIRESGLIQIDFKGMGAINYYNWTTSIFLHRDINLSPRSKVQPEFGIASLICKVTPE
jgi:hypothetical protein